MSRVAGLILICLLLHSALSAQPRLSASTTEVLIGDKFELRLDIPGADAADWLNQDIVPADTVRAVQVIATGDAGQLQGREGVSKTWTVAIYDTGLVWIPRLEIITRGRTGIDTNYSNNIPIRVSGVIDSTGLAPIKPIIYEPVRFSDYLPYIAGLLGVILLGIFIWWWSKRPKTVRETIEIIDEKPPHEVALDALYELEGKKLWENGMIKEFHSELSHILRKYLVGRYGISALESTTGELREMLKPILSSDQYDRMIRMMNLEDLIKFAKATPPPEVHGEYLEFVRQFIVSTKPQMQTEANA